MTPAHQRIQIQGTLGQAEGGGSEIFEFGVACASGMTPQALSAALAPVISDFWNGGAQNGIAASATVRGVRVENLREDGTVGDSFYTAIQPEAGSFSNLIPTIVSHAVTLETETPGSHGRMVRGRFYPPASCSVVGSTATLNAAEVYANAWAGLLNGFNDQGANVCVASTTGGGQIAPVTGVSVDTVIDTVRRRKNHVTAQRSPVVTLT